MEIELFLLAFSLFCKSTLSLRCFKCEPEKIIYERDTLLCEHFDGTDQYLVKCPYSTMCFKKEITLELRSGLKTTSFQRGCALQIMSDDQQKINGKWTHVKNIYEVYKEGCEEDPSDGEKSTKTVHCYCRGDKCNGVNSSMSMTYSLMKNCFVLVVFCFLIS